MNRKEVPDDFNNGEIKKSFHFFQQILSELLCVPGIAPGTGEYRQDEICFSSLRAHRLKNENKARALSAGAKHQGLSIPSNTQIRIKFVLASNLQASISASDHPVTF